MATELGPYSSDLLFQLSTGDEHELEHIEVQIMACATITDRYVQQIGNAQARDEMKATHELLSEWRKQQREVDKCLRRLIPDLQYKPPLGSRGRARDLCIIAGLRCFIGMAIVQGQLSPDTHLHCRSDLSTLQYWHRKLLHVDGREYIAMLVPVSIKSDMIVYIHLKRHESRSGKDRSAVRRSYSQVSVDSSSWHGFAEELSAVQRPANVPSWHLFIHVSHKDAQDWAKIVKQIRSLEASVTSHRLGHMQSLTDSAGKGQISAANHSTIHTHHRSVAQITESSIEHVLRQCHFGSHAHESAEPFKALFQEYIMFLMSMAKFETFPSRLLQELGLSGTALTAALSRQHVASSDPAYRLAFKVDLVYLVSSGLKCKLDLEPDLGMLRLKEPHNYERIKTVKHHSEIIHTFLQALKQDKHERDIGDHRGRPSMPKEKANRITEHSKIERQLYHMMTHFTMADRDHPHPMSSAEMTAHIAMVGQLERAVGHMIDATAMLSQPSLAPSLISAFHAPHVYQPTTQRAASGVTTAEASAVAYTDEDVMATATTAHGAEPSHSHLLLPKHETFNFTIVSMVKEIRDNTASDEHGMTSEARLLEVMKKYRITKYPRDTSVVNTRIGTGYRHTEA